MATVLPTSIAGSGVRAIVNPGYAIGFHTFVYRPGTGQILIGSNTGGVSGAFRISGADGVTWGAPGAGDLPLTPSYPTVLTVGQRKMIFLDEIRAYLQGVISIEVQGLSLGLVLLNP